jgi:hypothetical protein
VEEEVTPSSSSLTSCSSSLENISNGNLSNILNVSESSSVKAERLLKDSFSSVNHILDNPRESTIDKSLNLDLLDDSKDLISTPPAPCILNLSLPKRPNKRKRTDNYKVIEYFEGVVQKLLLCQPFNQCFYFSERTRVNSDTRYLQPFYQDQKTVLSTKNAIMMYELFMIMILPHVLYITVLTRTIYIMIRYIPPPCWGIRIIATV